MTWTWSRELLSFRLKRKVMELKQETTRLKATTMTIRTTAITSVQWMRYGPTTSPLWYIQKAGHFFNVNAGICVFFALFWLRQNFMCAESQLEKVVVNTEQRTCVSVRTSGLFLMFGLIGEALLKLGSKIILNSLPTQSWSILQKPIPSNPS